MQGDPARDELALTGFQTQRRVQTGEKVVPADPGRIVRKRNSLPIRGSRILSGMLFMISVAISGSDARQAQTCCDGQDQLISLADQDKMVLFAAKGVADLIHSDKVKAFAFSLSRALGMA